MVDTPEPKSSMARVILAADKLGLTIDVRRMEQSTRTAEDAAAACGCEVGQIVKSLIFENAQDQSLVLLLVSGRHNADMQYLSDAYGLNLKRCDARRVRNETGFAIGGVAPIGHLNPPLCYFDECLLDHQLVWAAAGRPDSVFSVDPKALQSAINCRIISVTR